MNECELILGDRGAGKSLGLQVDCLSIAAERALALVGFDLKGDWARSMVGHLSANGMESRTYIEIARDIDRVLQWPLFKRPDEYDVLQQDVKLRLATESFLQPLWGSRDLKDGRLNHWTREWAEKAVRLWACQPAPLDIGKLFAFFDPADPDRAKMIAECTDRNGLVRSIRLLDERCARSSLQFDKETGASRRLLEPLRSAVIWRRHGKNPLWKGLIEKKAQVYFDLSGISPSDARLLVLLALNGILSDCREHFTLTGKPLPVLIVLEEAGFLDLVTPQVIASLQSDRAAGVSYIIVSQTEKDFDEDVLEQVMGLTYVHRYYRMNSGRQRAARDLGDPTFDPKAVHYTRERLMQNGWEDAYTFSAGESSDGRETETVTQTFRATHRVVVDEYYKTPQLHEQEFRTGLATLRTGQRYTKDGPVVRKETVTPLEKDPWPLDLTRTYLLRAIARIRQRPIYQEVECPPSPSPVPAAAPSSPPQPPETPRASRLATRRRNSR